MLTIEEYTARFGAKRLAAGRIACWGSAASNLPPGVRLIKEGLLQFTPESADCWAGPWDGGYAQFHLKDHSQETVGGGPNKGKLRLPIAEIERAERRAKEERKAIYAPNNNVRAPRHAWGEPSEYMGYPSVEFPVRLWMAGNDDTSYSKCYRNEKEALQELDLFIANEPLDFHDVVQGFNFIFTN